jgi:hypothetical protein
MKLTFHNMSNLIFFKCFFSLQAPTPLHRERYGSELKNNVRGGDIGTQGNVTFYRQTPDKTADYRAHSRQKCNRRKLSQTAGEPKTAQQLIITAGISVLVILPAASNSNGGEG